MRQRLLRLDLWAHRLAVKTWPDNSLVRRVRTLCSGAASRLIFGAITGLVLGALCAVLGIGLSGIDVSELANLYQMAKVVALFAVVWAVIFARFFDFCHLYLKFVRSQEARWTCRVLGKQCAPMADEIDIALSALSFEEQPESLDRGVSGEP